MNSFLFIVSFFLVAFGQPSWSPLFAIITSLIGYALFWNLLLTVKHPKQRFLLGGIWFSGVQLIQLSWLLSHPFSYIYAVWILFSLGVGAQFGLLSLLINKERISTWRGILLVASSWTILEWLRLFFLSGYVWNPVGLSLAANVYSLQWASVIGTYGLSFWVILTNLLALRAFWLKKLPAFLGVVSLPFLFGFFYLSYHGTHWQESQSNSDRNVSALLVQTAFPVEASLRFSSRKEQVDHLFRCWDQILQMLARHQQQKSHLILFPEMVVPFGTYSYVYPYQSVKALFLKQFGEESLSKLPALEPALAYFYQAEEGATSTWFVNNAYWSQAIANFFDADVVIGLQDAEDIDEEREYYSSAIRIIPESRRENKEFTAERYAKRVLVPMGEYIPLSFCAKLAARYGIYGSFMPGREAVVWKNDQIAMSPSICYEEMFCGLVREGRQQGANLLINLTNDAWFPGPLLMRQHLEHARLRTVENGVPLLRACNTGITCAVDPMGRDIALLGEDDHSREALSGVLPVQFGLYDYRTLYGYTGDWAVIGFCFLNLLVAAIRRNPKL